VNQYREGKVKSTPERGVKEFLKPCVYKQGKLHGASRSYSVPFASLIGDLMDVAA